MFRVLIMMKSAPCVPSTVWQCGNYAMWAHTSKKCPPRLIKLLKVTPKFCQSISVIIITQPNSAMDRLLRMYGDYLYPAAIWSKHFVIPLQGRMNGDVSYSLANILFKMMMIQELFLVYCVLSTNQITCLLIQHSP